MKKLGATLALVLLTMCGFLAAQAGRGPATLDDLLTEVRGLRADISRLSAATVRTQMVVARMQIQEQRITGVLRQVAEVQNQLVQARQLVAGLETPLKQAETNLARARAEGGGSADDRHQMELGFADLKGRLGAQLTQAQQRVQELSMRESELINQFSSEQIRWNDFNERLDALERSFTAP